MIDCVLSILRRRERLLLIQRASGDSFGATWAFPGGRVNPTDKTQYYTISRELYEGVGIHTTLHRQLCQFNNNGHRITVFVCEEWEGVPKPSCDDVIGVGWFTIAEMYASERSLSPFINYSLMYIAYLLQHYDRHPHEWRSQWTGSGWNG